MFSGPTADVLTNYLSLLRAVLAYNTVSEADRERMRVFRRENNIVHQRHLEFLAQLHWTPDEYEVSRHESLLVFCCELSAIDFAGRMQVKRLDRGEAEYVCCRLL